MRLTQLEFSRAPVRTTRRLALLATLALAWPASEPVALAQGVDCGRLRAEIDAASAQDGGSAEALRQQQYELQRTKDYSDSIGCGEGLFGTGLFGGGPPQCAGLEASMRRMEANIDRLQAQMQDGSGSSARRRALIEQFNNACSASGSENQVPIGDGQVVPVDPDAAPGDQATPEAPQGRVRALCVRHCDGGYFPITDDASSAEASLDHLGELCKAMCPGTEASLYTTAPSGSLDTAVAPDGTAYTALPAAFKFQKSFDPTCSCKPPHQSWVEALAGAEKLIQGDKRDVTVTQRMSDQMARPGAATRVETPARTVKAARKPKPAAPSPGLDDQAGIAIPPPPQDDADLTRQFRPSAPAL